MPADELDSPSEWQELWQGTEALTINPFLDAQFSYPLWLDPIVGELIYFANDDDDKVGTYKY